MKLAQPFAHPPSRAPVMQEEVEGVVNDVPEVETRADRPGTWRSERRDEQSEEHERERDRERRRQDEPPGVIRMVVMHAVDHPVQSLAQTMIGLEMEDRPVSPVLAERPEQISGDRCRQRSFGTHPRPAEHREQRNDRQEDQRRRRGVRPRQTVEPR